MEIRTVPSIIDNTRLATLAERASREIEEVLSDKGMAKLREAERQLDRRVLGIADRDIEPFDFED